MFPSGAGCSRCFYTPASKYLPGLDESPEAGADCLTGGQTVAKGSWRSTSNSGAPMLSTEYRLPSETLQPWSRWHETPDTVFTQYLLGTHQFTSSQKPPGGEHLGPAPPHARPESRREGLRLKAHPTPALILPTKPKRQLLKLRFSPPCQAPESLHFQILILTKA